MRDSEFDAYLTSQLESAPLPDEGFTRAVAARIERHRRSRRVALIVASGLAGAAAAIALLVSPGPAFPSAAVTPGNIVATMVLAAACGLVWIATESRRISPSL